MWTPEESTEIQNIAKTTKPGIKTHAIPQGLQVEKGPDAIVEYLIEKVPGLLNSSSNTNESFVKAATEFREFLPDLESPRFVISGKQSPYEYSAAFRETQHPPWLFKLTEAWQKLMEEPYVGLTTDGTVEPGLFKIQDEGVPMGDIVQSVQKVLKKLSPEQKEKVAYPLNAREWRAWSNPEFLLRPFGLRLEEQDESIATAILSVIETTFSPEGYQKALAAMRINHFLGEICKVPRIMNKYSYNFLLFGEPSLDKPWGWTFYGHHLCLSVFLVGNQIVISPTFTGAEPNVIDEGEFVGTQILNVEGDLGLKLMQSLPDEKKPKARVFELMHDPGMLQTGDLTKDRWNKDDQRHLCGAFRDNRIVPYEGVLVSEFSPEQQQLVLSIAEQFVLYLPEKSRKLRLEAVKSHFDRTYFSWIGGWSDSDPFYYRIQSPVIVCEFDHHSGVFLSNEEPAKFHTHTILRTPNAGDYGCALREKKDWVQ